MNNQNEEVKQSVRYLALTTLDKIIQSNAYSNIQLNQALQQTTLSAADKRLLTNIVYGVIQHRLTLEYWLNPFIKGKKLDSWVKTLLIMSLYQYRYLDRVPNWAVTDEAIKIAKVIGHAGIRKLVTAVLHTALRNNEIDFAKIEDPIKRMSIEYSVPQWLIDELNRQYGLEATRAVLTSINNAPHQSIRINRKLTTVAQVKELLTDQQFDVRQSPVLPDSLIVSGPISVADTDLFQQGLITIQDESATLAVDSMALAPSSQVLDACAAPGGKTVQIAQDLDAHASGKVTALDIHPHKIKLINQVARRLSVSDVVEAVKLDARKVDEKYADEAFDCILVDAPCSGFGLIRRKPEIRYDKSLADSLNLQKIQLSILNAVAPKVKKGGIITYSTCTILQQENDQVVTQFIQSHPDFSIIPTETTNQLPSHSQPATLTILPGDFNSDGFFVATIKKSDK